jgi:ferredoxin-thioredoxin reductase catalytic chain
MNPEEIPEGEVEARFALLDREAGEGGYHLNPDTGFTRRLIRGLLYNEGRFGYPACPCRLAFGSKEDDLDIICPCDYRDSDLNEHGACYCALYVSGAVLKKEQVLLPVPERRPPRNARRKVITPEQVITSGVLKYPVWRCRVCGYLCARDEPPLVCPVCKAKKDRFEKFI